MVLAVGCGDSNGGNGDDDIVVVGPRPIHLEILSGPDNFSFMGLPVDLTGVVLRVTYSDMTQSLVTDISRMRTEPAIAHGFLDLSGLPGAPGEFTGNPLYTVLLSHNGVALATSMDIRTTTGVPNTAPRTIDGNVNDDFIVEEFGAPVASNWIVPVMRLDPTLVSIDGRDNHFLSASGFQVTGANNMRQEYYVDDTPVFTGLTAEARFVDGSVRTIPLNIDSVDWDLFPNYDNGNESGTGNLFITIGRHPDFQRALGLGQTLVNASTVGVPADLVVEHADPGITVVLPLRAVHHVVEFGFSVPPNLPPFFYFDADNHEAWLARSAGTVFSLRFSNGTTRTLPIEQAQFENEIWEAQNPGGDDPLDLVVPGLVGARPFRIVPIGNMGTGNSPQGTHFFNNRTPRITYYYRGHRLDYAVPVLTRFISLNVDFAGDVIDVNAQRSENDFRVGMDANAFARLLTVTATYSAFADANVTADLVLTYSHWLAASGVPGVLPGAVGAANWELVGLYAPGQAPVPRSIATVTDLGLPTGMREGRVFTMDFGINEAPWPTLAARPGAGVTPNTPAPAAPPVFPQPGVIASASDWGVSNNPSNNDRVSRVTIFYNQPHFGPDDFELDPMSGVLVTGQPNIVDGRVRTARVDVRWSNID